MSEIKLAIGCVAASGMLHVGQCNMIKSIHSLNELFAELSLTSNEADIHAYFERPMSNPTIFTTLGVCASPSVIREKVLVGMVNYWNRSCDTDAVMLVFKDKAWQIMSRVEGHLTDGLVPLHEFLYQFYKTQGLTEHQLERLNLNSNSPFVPLPESEEIKPFYYNAA